MAKARKLLPFSRIGMGLWAWRNRGALFNWTTFGIRAATQLPAGGRNDVLAEARLRAVLTRDARTRDAGLRLSVQDGVALLQGTVDPMVADLAVGAAERTSGIKRVRNELQTKRRRAGLRRSA